MNFLCLQENAVDRRISSGWRTQFFYFDIYHCGFELFYSKKIVFKKLSAINQLHSYLGLITLLLIDMIILFLHYIMTVCEGQNSFLIEISETWDTSSVTVRGSWHSFVMNMELQHKDVHVTGCQSWTWCHPPLPGPSHESHQRHICHTVTRPPTLPSTQAAKY